MVLGDYPRAHISSLPNDSVREKKEKKESSFRDWNRICCLHLLALTNKEIKEEKIIIFRILWDYKKI